jgi:hypothetical protein
MQGHNNAEKISGLRCRAIIQRVSQPSISRRALSVNISGALVLWRFYEDLKFAKRSSDVTWRTEERRTRAGYHAGDG